MGRIVFVTVGTSAITNRDLWEHRGDLSAHLPQKGEWGKAIRDAEAQAIEELKPRKRVDWLKVEARVGTAYAAFEAALTEHHRLFWRNHPPHRREHIRRTSAETVSTWLAGEENLLTGGPLQRSEDKVVLMVSRTCAGQMAGRINEAIFREFLFAGDGEPEIPIETIDDLRLEGILERDGEAASLSDQVRRIYRRHAGNVPGTPIFNITGGFKGLIPAITEICLEDDISIVYLHESMKGTVRLHLENGRWQDTYEAIHTHR